MPERLLQLDITGQQWESPVRCRVEEFVPRGGSSTRYKAQDAPCPVFSVSTALFLGVSDHLAAGACTLPI
jgi:hypothetical protein